jgi:hypothetical protein
MARRRSDGNLVWDTGGGDALTEAKPFQMAGRAMVNIAVDDDENGPVRATSGGAGKSGAPRGLGGTAKGHSGGGTFAKPSADATPRRALGDISNRGKGLSAAAPAGKSGALKPAAAESRTSLAAASAPPAAELPPIEHFFPSEQEPPLPCFDRSGIVPEEYVEAACAAHDRRTFAMARTPSLTTAALSPSATPSRRANLIPVEPTPQRPRLLADALDAAGAWSEAEQLEAALAISLTDFDGAAGDAWATSDGAGASDGDAADGFDTGALGGLNLDVQPGLNLEAGPSQAGEEQEPSSAAAAAAGQQTPGRATGESAPASPPIKEAALPPESPLIKANLAPPASRAPMPVRPPPARAGGEQGSIMSLMEAFREDGFLGGAR